MFKFLVLVLFSVFTLCAKESFTSTAYVLKNLYDEKIISEKETKQVLPIASINKLFTYFIVKDFFQENELITIPGIQLIFYEKESRAGVRAEETYKFSDLVYALLIPSGNDVARVFEHKLKEKNFNYSQLASIWLQKHGFYNTVIQEPIGLSSETKSNISDLWKLLEMVYNTSESLEALQKETYTIYTTSKKPLLLKNRNPLFRYKNYKIFGKTGSTKKAGFCFLGFLQHATYTQKIYGIIFLGANDFEKELIHFINLLD